MAKGPTNENVLIRHIQPPAADEAFVAATEDMASFPETVGERRAALSQSAADWKPRDILVRLLRSMDAGKIDPSEMIVVYRAGPLNTYYQAAGPDIGVVTALGMLEEAKFLIMQDA